MDAVLRSIIESALEVQKQKLVLEKIAATAKESQNGTMKKVSDQVVINILELSARLYLSTDQAKQAIVPDGFRIFSSWSLTYVAQVEQLFLNDARTFLTDVLHDIFRFIQLSASTGSAKTNQLPQLDLDELRQRITVFVHHITDCFIQRVKNDNQNMNGETQSNDRRLHLDALAKWVRLLAKNGGPLVSHLLVPKYVSEFARTLDQSLSALRNINVHSTQSFEFGELAYFYLFIGTLPVSVGQLLPLLKDVGASSTLSSVMASGKVTWSELATHSLVPDSIRSAAAVFDLLESAWNTLSSDQRVAHFCAVLRIGVKFSMSAPNPRATGIALAHATRLIDASQAAGALRTVLDEATPDAAIDWYARLAETMVDWLAWPSLNDATYVALLSGLLHAIHGSCDVGAAEQVLQHVLHSRLGLLISLVSVASRRKLSLTMLTELLTAIRCPARLFHAQIDRLCTTARSLKQLGDRDALRELAMLVSLLVFVNPGYPTLYRPLEDAFDGVPRPSSTELRAFVDRHAALRERSRSASAFSRYNEVDVDIVDLDAEQTSTGPLESTQPFVGLVNRGNTCYANAVIQCMFMCTPFRNIVLTFAADAEREPIAFALQRCFALLAFSRARAADPSALLRVSRPPWFEDGLQQDCVEYLVTLLDRTREQFLGVIGCELTSKPNATNSAKVMASASLDKRCIVDRYFGGLLATTLVCTACHSASTSFETCTNIALALPPRCSSASAAKVEDGDADISATSTLSTDKQTPSSSLQASTATPVPSDTPTDTSPLPAAEFLQPASMTESVSVTQTTVNPAEKPVPQAQAQAQPQPPLVVRPPSNVLSLLRACFRSEALHGTNQYYCEHCAALRDAVKRVGVRDAPPFLALNVLRFAFNRMISKRTKRVEFVRLDAHFLLRFADLTPTLTSKSATSTGESGTQQRIALYRLLAIVIHSGYSADAGHYYTYVRSSSNATATRDALAHTLPTFLASASTDTDATLTSTEQTIGDSESSIISIDQVLGETEAAKAEKADASADGWCLFNDESVEAVEWTTIADYLHKYRFSDTPYLLVYERSRMWLTGGVCCTADADAQTPSSDIQLSTLDESDTMDYTTMPEDRLPAHVRLFLEDERRKMSQRNGATRFVIGARNDKPPPPGPSCGAPSNDSDGPRMVF